MNWPRLGSAALAVDDQLRLVLGRRAKDPGRGAWVPPGGRVEPFEPLATTVEREFLEETGLVIRVIGRPGAAGVFELLDAEQHRVVVYSLAEVVGGEPRPGDDVDALGFFTPAQVEELAAAGELWGIGREVLAHNGWISCLEGG